MEFIFITDRKGILKPKPIKKNMWEKGQKFYSAEGYREATDEEIKKYYEIKNEQTQKTKKTKEEKKNKEADTKEENKNKEAEK